jgi:nucleoside diphosphate kinase
MSEQILPQLKELQEPSTLSRQSLIAITSQRESGEYERLSLSDLDKEYLQRVSDVLAHPHLDDLIDDGAIALALLKPDLNDNKLGLSDEAAASAIIDALPVSLEPVFSLSVLFTQDMLDAFWGGHQKEKQQQVKPNHPQNEGRFSHRWEEFSHMMTNGVSTLVLLYSPTGDAVEMLRSQIGHWSVDGAAEDSIRGTFATGRHNNLIHGSDSKAAVRSELAVIREHVREIIQ